MRSASKLLIKPLRWTRRQWVRVRRRARKLGKRPADYVRDLVGADLDRAEAAADLAGGRDHTS